MPGITKMYGRKLNRARKWRKTMVVCGRWRQRRRRGRNYIDLIACWQVCYIWIYFIYMRRRDERRQGKRRHTRTAWRSGWRNHNYYYYYYYTSIFIIIFIHTHVICVYSIHRITIMISFYWNKMVCTLQYVFWTAIELLYTHIIMYIVMVRW